MWGADVLQLGFVPDSGKAIKEAIEKASDANLLVTTGGISVGEHDLIRYLKTDPNFSHGFWRIAMRPGKPLMFARIGGGLLLLAILGNPVLALICALLFLKPAIATMSGQKETLPPFEKAILSTAMPANGKREDYVRANITQTATGLTITPLSVQDSSMLKALAFSDGLIRRPAFAPAADAGEIVEIIRFGETLGVF
jgi:molybdopterin molybdotransferase